MYPEPEIGVTVSGEKNADCCFRFLVLTGERATSQLCFFSIIDLLLYITSGSFTSSFVLVIFIVEAEAVGS